MLTNAEKEQDYFDSGIIHIDGGMDVYEYFEFTNQHFTVKDPNPEQLLRWAIINFLYTDDILTVTDLASEWSITDPLIEKLTNEYLIKIMVLIKRIFTRYNINIVNLSFVIFKHFIEFNGTEIIICYPCVPRLEYKYNDIT